MALSTLVKISGVNNLSDARYCAGMGATILGFCPEPGRPGYTDTAKYREIIKWISGVKIAGEFYEFTFDQIDQAQKEYHFDYIQFNDPLLVGGLEELHVPLLFDLTIEPYHDLRPAHEILDRLKGRVEIFIAEGENLPPQWAEKVGRWSHDYPLLLGTGITRDNVVTLMKQYNFKGISLKGGTEVKPGYYDFGELAGILEALEL